MGIKYKKLNKNLRVRYRVSIVIDPYNYFKNNNKYSIAFIDAFLPVFKENTFTYSNLSIEMQNKVIFISVICPI